MSRPEAPPCQPRTMEIVGRASALLDLAKAYAAACLAESPRAANDPRVLLRQIAALCAELVTVADELATTQG